MDKIEISLPNGHNYKDRDDTQFFNDVFMAIGNEYEINAYDYEILYIKSYDAVYSGASACNAFVQNSIMDMFTAPYKGVFWAVDDDDDKADIISDFF